jgi:NAD(P)-dependent dehydrogenase (short-subunit alcohol dehydrogenase family)
MVGILQADIFTNKTVLITGAASGIGRGLALHAAKLQMNVVLMDLNKNGLSETHSLMVDCPSMIIQCDVSNLEDFAKAKEQIESEFGTVHFLFNNAGIFLEGRAWKADQKNWQRIIDVNLMSIIYGLNLFVDEMVASQERCHIINTSSMAGIIVGPALAPYTTTKHAVVGLTRTLHEDLADNDMVGVSVLCPGLVQTNIIKRDHLGLALDESSIDQHESAKNNAQWLADGVKEGMSPEDLATIVFKKIESNEFWILTHPEFVEVYETYADEITANKNNLN